MSDENQVAMLRRGVAEWNAWRNEVRRGAIDLSGEDLSSLTLRGADLRKANLREANLREADVREGDCRGSDLTGANLIGAKLFGANLRDANLSKAKLNGAAFIGANLIFANLAGASLKDALFGGTIFGDVDLSTVIGLETCRHARESFVDHLTLQRSGPLPLEFLRGAGLTDSFINNLQSLPKQKMHSCFISHSSKDDEIAKRLRSDLQNKGVRCWSAPHDLPIGAKIWDGIDEAIGSRDKLLLILSKNAIGSDWVEDEVNKAFAEESDRKQLVLFPVRIDDTVMKTTEPWARKLRDQRNIGDLTNWKDHKAYQATVNRLHRDLTVQEAQAPAQT